MLENGLKNSVQSSLNSHPLWVTLYKSKETEISLGMIFSQKVNFHIQLFENLNFSLEITSQLFI